MKYESVFVENGILMIDIRQLNGEVYEYKIDIEPLMDEEIFGGECKHRIKYYKDGKWFERGVGSEDEDIELESLR